MAIVSGTLIGRPYTLNDYFLFVSFVNFVANHSSP